MPPQSSSSLQLSEFYPFKAQLPDVCSGSHLSLAAPPSYSTAQDYLASVHLAFKAFVPTGSLGLPGCCSKAGREPIFFLWGFPGWHQPFYSSPINSSRGKSWENTFHQTLVCHLQRWHGPTTLLTWPCHDYQGSSCSPRSWVHLCPVSLDLLAAVHAVGHPFLLTRLLCFPRQANVLLSLWLPLLGLC